MDLKNSMDSLQREYNLVLNKADRYKDENDSLHTVLLNMEKPEPDLAYSDAQKEIMAEIENLHKGWEQLFVDKDIDAFLQNFTTDFHTNSVRIDTRNKPSVQLKNSEGFKEFLQSVIDANVTLEFGKTRFYTIHVEGEKYATSYVSELEVRHNGETIQTSTIESLVAGGKYDGKWLIGNYAWVKFDYYDISENFQ
jgi:hypothetical protein